ncbi:MAG TPA: PEGA domain-containing protein [Phycisphaerales bacterium]|nr:PEGA domain-containing protein [Phycisphaerales bacterium]
MNRHPRAAQCWHDHRGLAFVVSGVAALGMLGGCVDRRIFISSEPSGATVFLNDVEVGQTPVEVEFTYFGVYDVRLRKEGYEPLVTRAEAKAPLHEQPGIDLVALAIPAKKTTRVEWSFKLEPSPTDDAALLGRAAELRTKLEPLPTETEPASAKK